QLDVDMYSSCHANCLVWIEHPKPDGEHECQKACEENGLDGSNGFITYYSAQQTWSIQWPLEM
ncbi:MAG: hypothetical protein U1E13_05385, partial [Methylophilaceae bacterium]|nr:hypothetical protein [Methylophilaceae bacterium]